MTNAPTAASWLIRLNLERQYSLKFLTGDVDEVIGSWMRQHPGQKIEDRPHEIVSTADLPLLTSAIGCIVGSTWLGDYRLDAGDRIAGVTRSAHLREEIHENASKYDPTRHITEKRLSRNRMTIMIAPHPTEEGFRYVQEGSWIYSLIHAITRSLID